MSPASLSRPRAPARPSRSTPTPLYTSPNRPPATSGHRRPAAPAATWPRRHGHLHDHERRPGRRLTVTKNGHQQQRRHAQLRQLQLLGRRWPGHPVRGRLQQRRIGHRQHGPQRRRAGGQRLQHDLQRQLRRRGHPERRQRHLHDHQRRQGGHPDRDQARRQQQRRHAQSRPTSRSPWPARPWPVARSPSRAVRPARTVSLGAAPSRSARRPSAATPRALGGCAGPAVNGGAYSCTITNTDQAATLTVTKHDRQQQRRHAQQRRLHDHPSRHGGRARPLRGRLTARRVGQRRHPPVSETNPAGYDTPRPTASRTWPTAALRHLHDHQRPTRPPP